MEFKLIKTIECRNTLGEGVQWDALTQCIWWTDIQSSRLYRYHWHDQELRFFDLPERLAAFALTDEPGIIIAAFASGFARYQINSGDCQWLARPEQQFSGTRFNDGRVDRQGRFWCGSMVEKSPALDANGYPVTGGLYCLQGKSAVRKLIDIGISNSLCWSRDGSTVYFADSLKQTIWAFDFNADTAVLSHRRVFARTVGEAMPDGSCIDSEDCLWNAEWCGGRVTRYLPDGTVSARLELPVTQVTCAAFGGPDMNCLLVTSAAEGLDDAQWRQQPLAGSLFIYETGVHGLEEQRVSLKNLDNSGN